MSLVLVDNFDVRMQKQNFERDSFKTIADMKAFPETSLPPIFHALCEEDGNLYIYNVNNTDNVTTGKWRIVQGGGGSGSGISNWTPEHEYNAGDLVVNDGRIYQSKAEHKSSLQFSTDSSNWTDLSNDDISQESGNILSRKSDGLYVAENPIGSSTNLGMIKVDNNTIVADANGTISVNYCSDDKTISIKNKKLNVNVSTKNTEVVYDEDFEPADIVSIELDVVSGKKYGVTLNCQFNPHESTIDIQDTTVSYGFNENYVLSFLGTFTAISTATVILNLKLATPLPTQTRHITIANNAYKNILATENDGLMVNLYDNIASTSSPGFVQPDGDTVTIDANGVITTMIGSNSVSRKEGQLIQLLEDGIYIDEDKTVPIATTEEEGKVKLDGETIIRVNPSDERDGEIAVNTEVIATQDNVLELNSMIDSVDLSTPTLVEYEEDELYEIAWSLVKFDEKPEYTEDDIDAILDKIDFSSISSGGGSTATEMTSESLQSIWNEVFGGGS